MSELKLEKNWNFSKCPDSNHLKTTMSQKCKYVWTQVGKKSWNFSKCPDKSWNFSKCPDKSWNFSKCPDKSWNFSYCPDSNHFKTTMSQKCKYVWTQVGKKVKIFLSVQIQIISVVCSLIHVHQPYCSCPSTIQKCWYNRSCQKVSSRRGTSL
jgi:hypothetical protein